MAENRVVGVPVPGLWSADEVAGRIKYLQDMKLPGLVYGRVLRSPYAHARILNIETSKAEKLKGVVKVVTARETPRIKYGIVVPDELPLCDDRVRYVGDEVALVVATDELTAAEALDLIQVDYEPLPALFDPEEAMAPGTPRIHDVEGNLASQILIERGDVAKAFQEADEVFEEEYRAPLVHQGNLEPICCMADYSGGRLTVWGPLQSPFLARSYLFSKPLDMPVGRIRVIQTPVGGAFGGKLDEKLYLLCALLAKVVGRPVIMSNSYPEELTTTRPRMPAIIRIRSGFKRDGRMVAKETRVIADNGAYCSLSPNILSSLALRTDSLYRTPAVKIEANLIYTNKVPTGQMRGFGNPQATFAWESHMDGVAERLDMDPAELRLLNATQVGDESIHGWKMISCGLTDCIQQAARAAGWREKRRKGGKGRGIGMACTIHVTSNKPFAVSITGYDFDGSACLARIDEDGTVFLLTGEVDLGQGSVTTMALAAAEELGVPLDKVVVLPADTDVAPYCLGTYASRVTFMGGNAARLAAADAKRQLLSVAAELMEAPPDELQILDGRIFMPGSPERSLTIGEVVKAAFGRGRPVILGRGEFETHPVMVDPAHKYGNQTITYSFACQVAEVEVDMETGQVTVEKVVAAHDLGKVINRLGAEGQVEGGVVQGMGYALSEELQIRDGKIINPGFVDYKMPSAPDAPEVECIFVESNDPLGPYGAKGVAETAINPVAGAIANAIYHATGVRVRSLPITAEKILAGLAGKRR